VATGDTQDIVRRLRALLPDGWFPAPPALGETETAPVLVGLLTGIGDGWSYLWGLIQATDAQTRIATSTGSFLDATAADYFGAGGLGRQAGEADAAYSARIRASLLPLRATRPALVAALTALTGQAPRIIEFRDAADCKGRGSLARPAAGGGYGYGSDGLRYGSMQRPFQLLVAVNGGSALQPAAIYAAINKVLPAGVIAWTNPSAS